MRFIALTLLALMLTQCGPPPLSEAPAHMIDYHIDLHKTADGELKVDATFNAPGEFQITELKVADTNVVCEVAGRAFGCGGLDFGFVRNTCSGMIRLAPYHKVLHVGWRTSRQEEEVLSLDIPALPELSVRSQLFKQRVAGSLEVDFGPEFRLADWRSCVLNVGDKEQVEVNGLPILIPSEVLNSIEQSKFHLSMYCTQTVDKSMKRDAPEFSAPTYFSGRRIQFSYQTSKIPLTKP